MYNHRVMKYAGTWAVRAEADNVSEGLLPQNGSVWISLEHHGLVFFSSADGR